jgi:hypothetical protein
MIQQGSTFFSFFFFFFGSEVVKIVDHFDDDRVPHNYSYNKFAYIQSSETNPHIY